jgi:hypothetical protein
MWQARDSRASRYTTAPTVNPKAWPGCMAQIITGSTKSIPTAISTRGKWNSVSSIPRPHSNLPHQGYAIRERLYLVCHRAAREWILRSSLPRYLSTEASFPSYACSAINAGNQASDTKFYCGCCPNNNCRSDFPGVEIPQSTSIIDIYPEQIRQILYLFQPPCRAL